MSKPSGLAAGLRKAGASVAAPAPLPAESVPQPAANERPKAGLPPSRIGTKAITVHLPADVRRELKTLAAQLERTSEDLISEGLNFVFVKYGKPEIAPRKLKADLAS